MTFALHHPLIGLDGNGRLGGTQQAVKAHLDLPDLAPLAEAGGVDLQGRTSIDVDATKEQDLINASLSGLVAVTGGMAPVPALIGDDGHIGLTASMKGKDITLSNLTVKQWLDGDTTADITAPGITGTLKSTGSFQADLLLSGTGITGNTLGSVSTSQLSPAPRSPSWPGTSTAVDNPPAGACPRSGAIGPVLMSSAHCANCAASSSGTPTIPQITWMG